MKSETGSDIKNNRRERIVLLLGLLFSFALYSITNQLGYLRYSEALILKWPLDDHLPLLPVFVIPYFYWFLQVGFSVILLMATRYGKAYYRVYAVTMISAMIAANLVFIILPTHVPRPELTGEGIFYLLLKTIYRFDQPYNCFPSLHAAIATINAAFCWLVIKDFKIRMGIVQYSIAGFVNFSGWVLICLSTVFTGQHYLPDLLGGILLAAFCLLAAIIANRNRKSFRTADFQ